MIHVNMKYSFCVDLASFSGTGSITRQLATRQRTDINLFKASSLVITNHNQFPTRTAQLGPVTALLQ